MTLGEWKVGVSFNPSQDPNVAKIKAGAAEMIDFIAGMSATLQQAHTGDNDAPLRNEIGRLCALAMTEIESAAMWAVKAATKQPMVP